MALTYDNSKARASCSQSLRPGTAPELSLMLQSAQCVFPQVAFFLEFRDVCRLSVVSHDIIPEAWENEVWHVAANNVATSSSWFSGFRPFELSNLDKQTIREFMKHVAHTTPVIDTDVIVVDSILVANRLIQFAHQMPPSLSTSRSSAGYPATTLLTRFEFDEEALEEYDMNPSAVPYSFPVIFDLGGDQHVLEMSWHSDGLKLTMHSFLHMSKAELCRLDGDDDDEEAEPVAFNKPLRVQLCSISSPVVLRNEYVLTHADVDANGYGICDTPSSPEQMREALARGFTCMVSVAELTQSEVDSGMPCKLG